MDERYEIAQLFRAKTEAAFASLILGLVCLALYAAKLPFLWHVTVLICAATVLLVFFVTYGIQSIISQIHISSDYVARAVEHKID